MKKLKILVSLLVTAALLLSVCALPSFAKDDALKIYVASDIHFMGKDRLKPINEAAVTVPGDEMYFYADYMGKMFHEGEAIVRSVLNDFASSDSDVLIVTGDMINDGYISDHEAIAAIFKEYEEKTGKKIYVVVGNHDIMVNQEAVSGEGLATLDDFKRIYADFGYNEALTRDEASASYTVDLNEKYRLICIDSNSYVKVSGDISEDVLNWVKGEVEKARADGKYLIGAMHHSLLDHFTMQSTFVGGFDTYGIENLAKIFADLGIKYMLTGHLHVNDITMATTDKGNKIYDVATGCLIAAGCQYRVLTFDDESVTVETKVVQEIDLNDLMDGYTEQQLQKLENDFQGYSREYCAAGLYYWVDLFLGAEKLSASLKIEQGTAEYEALDTMLGYVRKAITLPLYDREGTPEVDSLSEVAALSGSSIPESDYDSALDIAAIYVISFFSGESSVKADSLETKIILEAVKGVIAYAIGQMLDDGTQSEQLYALLKHAGVPLKGLGNGTAFTTELAKLTFMQTAANSIVKVMIAPLLDSISYDAYAPDDLNVTLEPYGKDAGHSLLGDGGQPVTLLQKILAFLKYIFAVLQVGLSHIR